MGWAEDGTSPPGPLSHRPPTGRERGKKGRGSCGTSGGGGDGGFEGLGFGEALLPGLPAGAVEGLGNFEVEGLADAVWRVLHQGAEHGLGAGEEAELALVVWAEVSRAEVEDACAFDLAGVDGGFAAAQAEVDEVQRDCSSLRPSQVCMASAQIVAREQA